MNYDRHTCVPTTQVRKQIFPGFHKLPPASFLPPMEARTWSGLKGSRNAGILA